MPTMFRLRFSKFHPKERTESMIGLCPFSIPTLNVVRGKELGLQTRKARSFPFTPLCVGFTRPNPGTTESESFSRRRRTLVRTGRIQRTESGWERPWPFRARRQSQHGVLLSAGPILSDDCFRRAAGMVAREPQRPNQKMARRKPERWILLVAAGTPRSQRATTASTYIFQTAATSRIWEFTSWSAEGASSSWLATRRVMLCTDTAICTMPWNGVEWISVWRSKLLPTRSVGLHLQECHRVPLLTSQQVRFITLRATLADDGILIYVKPALQASDSADLFGYSRTNPALSARQHDRSMVRRITFRKLSGIRGSRRTGRARLDPKRHRTSAAYQITTGRIPAGA